MTIEHMPDGSKQYTSPEGVVTRHADMSAAMTYRDTGKRASYETPDGKLIDPAAAPAGGAPAGGAPAPAGGQNMIDQYKARCRNVGKARAMKALGLKPDGTPL